MKYRIFISSVQREFARERKALADYIRRDALFGRFFEVFIFEETPAASDSAQKVYLGEAKDCDVYLGLIGAKYGNVDEKGISPTEREYDVASSASRHVLVFVREGSASNREQKEAAFLRKVESERVRRSFRTIRDLRETLAVSLVRFLEEQGKIQTAPFDMCVAEDAKLTDLSVKKMRDFVRTAREVRGFKLPVNVPVKDLLTRLNLIRADGGITNAAVLLFGKNPQKFFINSEVKCAQFYGAAVEKPMADHQIYQGDLFELADQATRFVMTHIAHWVGTRAEGDSVIVPTKYELPYDAVKEAIVNAICHRDYTSHQSVQVMLFADRLEVWNAGRLPRGLTIADLKKAHSSLPPNELLALPMYLKGAIEKTGTGTEDMVKQCRSWGLADPEFQDGPDFRVAIRRQPVQENARVNEKVNDRVNEKVNERQGKIISIILKDPCVTQQKLSIALGISLVHVNKNMKRLQNLGLIRRVGPDKGGHWEVVEE